MTMVLGTSNVNAGAGLTCVVRLRVTAIIVGKTSHLDALPFKAPDLNCTVPPEIVKPLPKFTVKILKSVEKPHVNPVPNKAKEETSNKLGQSVGESSAGVPKTNKI